MPDDKVTIQQDQKLKFRGDHCECYEIGSQIVSSSISILEKKFRRLSLMKLLVKKFLVEVLLFQMQTQAAQVICTGRKMTMKKK